MSRRPRSRSGRGRRYLPIVLLVGAACSGGSGDVTTAPSPPPAQVSDPLREIARDEGTVRVIVDLAVERDPDGTWSEKAIADAQRKLLAALGAGATVAARYETTPQLALEVDERALKELRASPLVLAIH